MSKLAGGIQVPSCHKSRGRPHLGILRMLSRKLLLVVAAGVVSAAFAYLGTGLHPIWWALWLAPIPVLAIAPRLHGSTAFSLGAIVWSIGEMNQWNYVTHAIELPPHITVLYFVVPALVFGFGVLFVRSLFAADHSSSRRLIFPFTGCRTNILPRWRRLTAHGAISLTHK